MVEICLDIFTRICSVEDTYKERLQELRDNLLIPRNYLPQIIDAQFKRIIQLPGNSYCGRRSMALERKTTNKTKTKTRIIAPIDFNTHIPSDIS